MAEKVINTKLTIMAVNLPDRFYKDIPDLVHDIDLSWKLASKRMARHLVYFYKDILISKEHHWKGALQEGTKVLSIHTGETTTATLVMPFEGPLTDFGTNPLSQYRRPRTVLSHSLYEWAMDHGFNPYAVGKAIAQNGVKAQYFSNLAYSEFKGKVNAEIRKKLKESDWWK